MAWQKGAGEGYGAAKDDALAIDPNLKCRAVYYQNYEGACRQRVGFVVERGKQTIGKGRLSRDAWADAFFRLGGRYEFGKAILPR